MPMALGMKDISNLGYMHCTTAVSLEMSDEPYFALIVNYVLQYLTQVIDGKSLRDSGRG